MQKLAFLLVLIFPAMATAQHSFELTPTLGYRGGGTFAAWGSDYLEADANVNSSPSLGLLFNVSLNRWLDLELMVDHQSTDLGDRRLWGSSSSNPDVDITYYHAGLLFQWYVGRSKMFIVGSLGVADLDLDLPGAGSESRFSTAFGGGVKVDLSQRLGLRFEMRGFWTDTSTGSWWNCDTKCDDCWDDCEWGQVGLVQGELKVGLIIKL